MDDRVGGSLAPGERARRASRVAHRPARALLPLLVALAPSAAGQASEELPRTRSGARIHCTPTTVELFGSAPQEVSNPIARALEVAGPGSTILLDAGDYPPFTVGAGQRTHVNSVATGGEEGQPVVVEGRGRVRVVAALGPSGTMDAIGVDQKTPNSWITFRRVTIVPGQRAGVIFYRQPAGKVHRGWSFEDCHVLGGFDHVAATGPRSKWGVSAHSVADFRFVGVEAPARVERIRFEHGFYIQNHRGPVLIENVHARELGRTFCQFTARASEGPPGEGDVTIRGCVVSDVGLAAGDAYKGGSALTFSGRLDGTIVVEDTVVRAGFDRSLRVLTRAGEPYGTGALVAWQGGEAVPNQALVLRDNRFLWAEGCGDRPLVSIGGTRRTLVVGRNVLESGGNHPALAIDPVDEDGRPVSPFSGSVYVAPLTRIDGDVTVGVETLDAAGLAGLQLLGSER